MAIVMFGLESSNTNASKRLNARTIGIAQSFRSETVKATPARKIALATIVTGARFSAASPPVKYGRRKRRRLKPVAALRRRQVIKGWNMVGAAERFKGIDPLANLMPF